MNITAIHSNTSNSFLGQPLEECSCYSSALKAQEITSKTFSFFTLAYYLSIDFLSYFSDWFKQKQISEIKNILSEMDFRVFVDKHFEIVSTNVENLEDANVICLGENHSNIAHRINNTKIIDFLCDETEDLILEEFDQKHIDKIGSLTEFQTNGLEHKNIRIKGWDKRTLESDREFFKAFDEYQDSEMVLISSANFFRKLLILLILPGIFFPHLLLGALPAIICNLSAWKLKLIIAKNNFKPILRKNELEFPERNRNMCKVINESLQDARKIFVIAGIYHLKPPKCMKGEQTKVWHDQYVVTNRETINALKDKSFVVLVPKSGVAT